MPSHCGSGKDLQLSVGTYQLQWDAWFRPEQPLSHICIIPNTSASPPVLSPLDGSTKSATRQLSDNEASCEAPSIVCFVTSSHLVKKLSATTSHNFLQALQYGSHSAENTIEPAEVYLLRQRGVTGRILDAAMDYPNTVYIMRHHTCPQRTGQRVGPESFWLEGIGMLLSIRGTSMA